MMEDVIKVGCVNEPGASVVRIVHISDTHTKHAKLQDKIPAGDILIHSGDFFSNSIRRHIFKESDFLQEISELNRFFSGLPHKYKIFVAGNHDLNFDGQPLERIQKLLTSAIYLQDSGCIIHGIKFYGSPWSALRSKSFARGFSRQWRHLDSQWETIPSDTDVLITHVPPWGELGKNIKDRVKPHVHLHGHIHSENGVKREEGIVFCNSAMEMTPRCHVIDYYTMQSPENVQIPHSNWNEDAYNAQSCVIS